jgi:hypothetical protein
MLFVVTLPSLAKFSTFGEVVFQVEGQSAILGTVALHSKVTVLGDNAFLGKALL